MKWFAFDHSRDQADALAGSVAADLKQVIAQKGKAVLAVSGGRSPVPFFEKLAAVTEVDWSRVSITLVDERLLPETHADSNAALVRRHLLQGAAAAATFLPMALFPEDADASVAALNAGWIQPDIAILGMGDDGHTASLFPGARALARGLAGADGAPVLAIMPLTAPHLRLSMTLPALLQCSKLYLSIQGEGKRAVFERAKVQADDALPVSHVLVQQRTPIDVYWAA